MPAANPPPPRKAGAAGQTRTARWPAARTLPGVATASSASSSQAILRFLRITLHVGFAVLLAVALLRLLPTPAPGPQRYPLAAVALAPGLRLPGRDGAWKNAMRPGTRLGTRTGTPSCGWPSSPCCGACCSAGSAEFSWLAFPLFFLHLHVLPRLDRAADHCADDRRGDRLAVDFQRTAGSRSWPWCSGPVFGAAFAVVTGLAYRALYREGENQRRAADELRRTRAELARSQHDAGVLAERGTACPGNPRHAGAGFFQHRADGARGGEIPGRAAMPGRAAQRLAIVQQTASEQPGGGPQLCPRPGPRRSLPRHPWWRACAGSATKTETEAAARGVRPALPVRAGRRTGGAAAARTRPPCCGPPRPAWPTSGLHAQARTAVVTLSFLGTEVTLDVYDDGAGFDPARPLPREAAAGRNRLWATPAGAAWRR